MPLSQYCRESTVASDKGMQQPQTSMLATSLWGWDKLMIEIFKQFYFGKVGNHNVRKIASQGPDTGI